MKTVLTIFVGLRGGGVSYAFEMVKGLVDNGCSVVAIVSNKMENIEKWRKMDGVSLFEVKGYSTFLNFLPNLLFFFLVEQRKIKKEIKDYAIDVIYIPMGSYWNYFVFKSFSNYRMIFTLHDVFPHDGKKTIGWRLSDLLAKKSNEIIILSDCFREEVRRRYNKSDDKIYTLSFGFQDYYENSTIKNSITKERTTEQVFTFLFYGRITQYKGIDILVKAFKIVHSQINNVKLLIAGSGDLSPYNFLFSDLDSKSLSIVNRWIEDDEVSGFFSGENVITVLPYKSATQSAVIPIAMSFGSLVIATRCSGIEEQITDGVTGVLANPDDVSDFSEKMLYVINHWNEMDTIIKKAKDTINRNSWKEIAKSLLERI